MFPHKAFCCSDKPVIWAVKDRYFNVANSETLNNYHLKSINNSFREKQQYSQNLKNINLVY